MPGSGWRQEIAVTLVRQLRRPLVVGLTIVVVGAVAFGIALDRQAPEPDQAASAETEQHPDEMVSAVDPVALCDAEMKRYLAYAADNAAGDSRKLVRDDHGTQSEQFAYVLENAHKVSYEARAKGLAAGAAMVDDLALDFCRFNSQLYEFVDPGKGQVVAGDPCTSEMMGFLFHAGTTENINAGTAFNPVQDMYGFESEQFAFVQANFSAVFSTYTQEGRAAAEVKASNIAADYCGIGSTNADDTDSDTDTREAVSSEANVELQQRSFPDGSYATWVDDPADGAAVCPEYPCEALTFTTGDAMPADDWEDVDGDGVPDDLPEGSYAADADGACSMGHWYQLVGSGTFCVPGDAPGTYQGE